jgi:hypothetical protein
MLIIEFCKRCGVRQPLVWHADDALWLRVTGSVGGVLCPKCFSRRAHEQGILIEWTPTAWRPREHEDFDV